MLGRGRERRYESGGARCRRLSQLLGGQSRRVAREVARSTTPVTWGGPLPASSDAAADALRALGGAGASWVVWGWPRSIDLVTEAAAKAGVELAPPPATFGGLATAE